MPIRSTLAVVALMLVGCGDVSQPPEEGRSRIAQTVLRRPALDRLRFVEGLNVVDRAPSGVSLAARVSENEITDWRVFDDQGDVVFQQRSDDGMSFDEACILSGGTPGEVVGGGRFTLACCWSDWGCLVCTADGTECEMECDTQRCRDANQVALPPVDPNDPDGPPSVAVNPDQLVIAVDPETPGWTVVDAGGLQMHLAATRRGDSCPVCVQHGDANVCWELPCLPAAVGSAESGPDGAP